MNDFNKSLNKQVKVIFTHGGGGYWSKNSSYNSARRLAKRYLKLGIKLGGSIDRYISKI